MHTVLPVHLLSFIKESNRIEGIVRDPLPEEITAHELVLSLDALEVSDIEAFVGVVAPGKPLRDRVGLNVRVGSYRPLPGDPSIRDRLGAVLWKANDAFDPYAVHVDYETLHPFMDGNGRSGRVIWLWQMLRQSDDPYALSRGFLHTFYYQTLSRSR